MKTASVCLICGCAGCSCNHSVGRVCLELPRGFLKSSAVTGLDGGGGATVSKDTGLSVPVTGMSGCHNHQQSSEVPDNQCTC